MRRTPIAIAQTTADGTDDAPAADALETDGDHPSGELLLADRPSGELLLADRPSGDRALGDRAVVAASGPARLQYAALPFRIVGDRTIEVMLLTSRENRRWIVPKGWPKKGRPGHVVAAREALEEAGLVGRIGKREVGSYRYVKQLADGGGVNCNVRIYPLEVKTQLDEWPEKGERETRWFDPAAAAVLVTEPGLRKLLRRTPKMLRRLGRRRR